mmetsp:Transcript_13916/g.18191  ORF Transcript_13916/g.18191 Transcript_13916/m.18191 type:complete len:246 (-) Transcript_13916:1197-1934(-)
MGETSKDKTILGTLCVCVTNSIPVKEAFEEEFEDRFSKRVHLVDQSPGFLKNEVHRPRPVKFNHKSGKWEDDKTQTGYYQVKTWWRSMEDFENWTRSKSFAKAHSKPKMEMFSGPSKIEVHEVFLSTGSIESLEKDKKSGFMSLDELSKFDGVQSAKIYIGLDGDVYDVSSAASFYGPGGEYHIFAGKDATRALAKGVLDEEIVNERPGDTSDLDGLEIMKLEDWKETYDSKYPIIGKLKPKSKL